VGCGLRKQIHRDAKGIRVRKNLGIFLKKFRFLVFLGFNVRGPDTSSIEGTTSSNLSMIKLDMIQIVEF